MGLTAAVVKGQYGTTWRDAQENMSMSHCIIQKYLRTTTALISKAAAQSQYVPLEHTELASCIAVALNSLR